MADSLVQSLAQREVACSGGVYECVCVCVFWGLSKVVCKLIKRALSWLINFLENCEHKLFHVRTWKNVLSEKDDVYRAGQLDACEICEITQIHHD